MMIHQISLLRRQTFLQFAWAFLVIAVASQPVVAFQHDKKNTSADVIIYGNTSAAVIAAVQVKQMGRSVIVVGPDKHLGGLTAGGLGWTDSGRKDAIGGLSRDFYHRIWKHYQADDAWRWQQKSKFGNRNQSPPGKDGDGATMWVFEPSVAEAVFEELVEEFEITVFRNQLLDRTPRPIESSTRSKAIGVRMDGDRIVSITMKSGLTFQGKMFLDATYEGDLMAAAGVSYHVGREANSVYGENWNGVQTGVLHHKHHFQKPVSPYRDPGRPDSGVLPLISTEDPGEKGSGDHRIQAYCFRMCLTDHAPNRIPFPKPKGYDPAEYELLLRVFENGWRDMFQKFDRIQNFKTDTNNHGPVSTDYIGMNYDYPEASYERRAEIVADHERYQKGLMYFMANDPNVPADVRTAMSKWGLAKDEFKDNGGWPHQIYVREARRMIGQYVMTEHDCLDARETPGSIGMGSYTLDSHNVQRYIKPDGFVQNEGDIGVHTPAPYEISYGSIVPKKDECANLLVPVCVSSSHMAFGSIRMEPVFMILGQSAATAACLSLNQDICVQDLDYSVLKKRLEEDRQVLKLKDSLRFRAADMEGVVVDDVRSLRTGQWTLSTANRPFVGSGYQHSGPAGEDPKSAEFQATLKPGRYDVRLYWPVNRNRASNVKVAVHHANGVARMNVDQRKRPADSEDSLLLGTFQFGTSGSVAVDTSGVDGYVILDAVQFIPVQKD